MHTAASTGLVIICVSVFVCVCKHASLAKWSGHQPTNRKVVGSICSVTTLVLPLFP